MPVAISVLRGGGAAILRQCHGSSRPLMSPSSYHSRCQLKLTGNGLLNFKFKLTTPVLFTPAESRRPFCDCKATQNEIETSPPPPSESPSPLPPSAEDEEARIKNVANTLDIRVGQILKIWRHEEADSLYVEEVDVGESEPRIICSGLVKYIPIDHLQDKKVVVLANLKPRNMRGVKSYGMLMAASDASHENVELLVPPEGSTPGERIWFGPEDEKENLPDAASPNQIQKKKIWELVQPNLKTNSSCAATLGEDFMRTSAGVVVSSTLKDANIS